MPIFIASPFPRGLPLFTPRAFPQACKNVHPKLSQRPAIIYPQTCQYSRPPLSHRSAIISPGHFPTGLQLFTPTAKRKKSLNFHQKSENTKFFYSKCVWLRYFCQIFLLPWLLSNTAFFQGDPIWTHQWQCRLRKKYSERVFFVLCMSRGGTTEQRNSGIGFRGLTYLKN